MKILQIANGDFFSTYGGGQVYVKNLVDEMIRQGLVVSVLSFVNKKSDVPFQKQNYKGINLYAIYQKDEQTIKTLIRQIAPDVIHIHAEKALISRISRELLIRNVVTVHHGGIVCPAGTLLNYRDEICKISANQENCTQCVLQNTKIGKFFYPLLKKMPLSARLKIGKTLSKLPFIYFVTPIGSANLYIENKLKEWEIIVQNIDRMIAPSYAIAENMEINGLDTGKIEIVPHGIPVNPIKINTFVPDINNRKLKFFYLGRIGRVKGIHILLKAFIRLNPNECELHLIGDNKGKYECDLIKKHAHYKNIFFHGKIPPESVNSRIKEYDILVHPAICLEVFGLNISEALAEGKPVIATRCGGAEMQIREGENGLLVNPNNEEELFCAMNWVIRHPEDVKLMSEKASVGVISMQKHVEKLCEIYYKV